MSRRCSRPAARATRRSGAGHDPARRSFLAWLLIVAAPAAGCAYIQPTPAGRANPPPPLLAAADAAAPHDQPAAPATARPVALGAGALTLERALAMALAHNPELAAGAWEAEAARARQRQTAAGHWP